MGDTGRELANVASLVTTSKAEVVAAIRFKTTINHSCPREPLKRGEEERRVGGNVNALGAVNLDVLQVTLLELLDHLLDRLHATLSTGLVGRVAVAQGKNEGGPQSVGTRSRRAQSENSLRVETGAVPVAREGLRVERDGDTPLLGDADQEVPRHPEVVAHVLALARTDLELPLRRHHLGVDARDGDAGVQARAVVRLDHVARKHLAGADTAVVRSLRARETADRPSVRATVRAKDGVLLLKTELWEKAESDALRRYVMLAAVEKARTHPGVRLGRRLHRLHARVTVVVLVRGAIVVVWAVRNVRTTVSDQVTCCSPFPRPQTNATDRSRR